MIILVKSQRAAQRVMRSITRYLESTLRLKVNLAKSKVALMSECSFLGFTIKSTKEKTSSSVPTCEPPTADPHGGRVGAGG